MKKLPMQPIVKMSDGIIRFQANAIVRFLIDWATPRGISMNELAMMDFNDQDREQFAQLIGYSVTGYGDLSYVSDASRIKADNAAEKVK